MTGHMLALALLLHACSAPASSSTLPCAVPAHTDSGVVCGRSLKADSGVEYASFRGVPYAKQPVGKLRFKELQPPEPWSIWDASTEGPICLQTDVFYEKIMQPQGMSEACIFANIHLPLEALPSRTKQVASPGLPVLVLIHGGGFAFGSGDADLYGPEYLVSKNVVVITFNYRLNVFGFLSMNTKNIPGNIGLRDQITLLRWVQRNVKNFGGNPDDVTLIGQSAGAASAHLLSLSKATEGLFRRVILMSGTATTSFYSPSPVFAQFMANQLLTILGIDLSTDPEDIHRQLIELPAEKLKEANNILIENIGLTTFVPTVESPVPGVTTIIDEDPDSLVAKGRGKHIPLLVGFTTAECESFRKRLEKFGLAAKLENKNSSIIVSPKLLFSTPPNLLQDFTKKIEMRYYNGNLTVDNFIKACTDGFYVYPALKLVETRAKTGGAPVFLYQFGYEGDSNVIKEALEVDYQGVGHVEDLTYVFKTNSVLGTPGFPPPSVIDCAMKKLMTDFFVNYMTCGNPAKTTRRYGQKCENYAVPWPENNGHQFLDIKSPSLIQNKDWTLEQQDVVDFFDGFASS